MRPIPPWVWPSRHGRLPIEQWLAASEPEREAIRERLRQSAREPARFIWESFERAMDAMMAGDAALFAEALERPAPPLPWIAPKGSRLGQRDFESDPEHPAAIAARLACFERPQWLELALPLASPMAKIKALEAACALGAAPGFAQTLGRLVASIDPAPEPGDGFAEARRLRSIASPAQARSLKDALAWCALFPFGQAFEICAANGLAGALRLMGEAVGPQRRPSPSRPDRLRCGAFFGRACQGARGEPLAVLIEASRHAPLEKTLEGLALLRGPGDPFGLRSSGLQERLAEGLASAMADAALHADLEASLPSASSQRASPRV